MALIKCDECGHQISSKAIACPKCGNPQSTASSAKECSQTENGKKQDFYIAPAAPISEVNQPMGVAFKNEVERGGFLNGHEFSETNSAKGSGIATGCLGGAMTSIILIIVGILISMTGIGAIIGIPMIIGGLLAPFLGPVLGLTNIKGNCPYCGTFILAQSISSGLTCYGCKKRIVIRNKRFYKID